MKAFIKAYCHNNFGDDLFIRILCARYPDVQFYIKAKEEFTSGIADIPNLIIIKPGFLFKAADHISYRMAHHTISEIHILKECDAVILLGGSMFIQNNNWKAIFDEYTFLQKQAKHFFVIGANFGPYTDPEFKTAYEEFFRKADDVCFRDFRSFYLFQNIGNVRQAPDIVFKLKTGKQEKENMISLIPLDLSKRKKLSQYQEQYMHSLADICSEALQNNLKVNIISFCRDQGDEKAAEEILSMIPEREKVHYVKYSINTEEILKLFQSSKYILSVRFHGMILGWLNNCIVCPVIYDQKMKNYLNDLHFPGKSVSIENIRDLSFSDVISNPLIDIQDQVRNSEEQFKALDSLLR